MHVLVAALNWGLGHAARSVPLVHYLLARGHRVSLASDGQAARLWLEEFPDIHVHQLPGYGVSYARGNLYLDLLIAAPRIWTAIRREHTWLQGFEHSDPPDLVISDNRYGIYSKRVPSILLSHQLQVRGSWPWADSIGQYLLDRWLSRFTEIWVPDHSEGLSLSGVLSKDSKAHPPVHRIGILSRFQPSRSSTPTLDILVLLSGPEPRRSHFEGLVLDQLTGIPGKHAVVRGTRQPMDSKPIVPSNIHIHDLLPAPALQDLLYSSRMLVSRSGYSTLMDLEATELPALLVPTPGQFEQEYLAERHGSHTRWVVQRQDDLDISQAWNVLKSQQRREERVLVSEGSLGSRLDTYLAPSA